MVTSHLVRAPSYDNSKYPLINWIFKSMNCVHGLEMLCEIYDILSSVKLIIWVKNLRKVRHWGFKISHMKVTVLWRRRRYSFLMQNVDSSAGLLGIRCWLFYFMTMWPGANCLISLILSFLTCKMESEQNLLHKEVVRNMWHTENT